MNRREMRAIEYYGYALIAGIRMEDAEDMTPGFITDMMNIRAKYDARMAGIRM